MKLLSPALAALSVSLLAALPALAMDQRQADAICTAWKLECPAGATTTASGPGKGTGALECKVKGRAVKEGPSVTCKDGKALAWGDWKAGKSHGLQVTMHSNGSWMEELFAEGKLEGRSVEYSAEGQLLKETFFLAGKKHGPARTYKEDGQLASEEFWDKGVKGRRPTPVVASGTTSERPGEARPKASANEGGAQANSPQP